MSIPKKTDGSLTPPKKPPKGGSEQKNMIMHNRFHQFCKTCPYKERTVEEESIFADHEKFAEYWIVTCEHYDLCGYVKYMISKEGKENETV